MTRSFAFFVDPTVAEEAPGVNIRRTVGGERLILLDPFFLFDHARVEPGARTDVVGFPRHPHRGIETLSVVFTGEVEHRDSLGNQGRVGPGGAQSMTAGNGIWHEEMMHPSAEGAEFLQLWFNLPQASKRIAPGYQGLPVMPVFEGPGVRVEVAAGAFEGVGSPLSFVVEPTVLAVRLEAGASVRLPAPTAQTAAFYLRAGSVQVGAAAVDRVGLAVLTDGEGLELRAGPAGAEFLFVSAPPLNEPVVQYRSFVMNSAEDIAETLAMIENGTFAT